MRTWMLAPDGYWSEVTARVDAWGDRPDTWPWPQVVNEIAPAEVGPTVLVDRTALPSVHGNVVDRWIANRIWDVVCTRGVDRMTATRVIPSDWETWLHAASAYADRPSSGDPHYAWAQRRHRWLLWAHTEGENSTPLDGAYLAVGATPAR